MHVPEGLDGITPAWLHAALEDDPVFGTHPIEGVEATRIGVGFGLDGQVGRLTVRPARPDRPRTLVAKLASAKNGIRERRFYARVAPHLPLRLLRCHGGAVDEDADRSVLLLEDLEDAAQGDAVKGAEPEQAEAVLREVARLHAAGPRAAELDPELEAWTGRADHWVERVRTRSARFEERFGHLVGTRALGRVERLPDDLPGAVRTMEAMPTTLIHTDLHLDNVMFPPEGPPVILDWPHARRGPAVLDVLRLLVEGVRVETRRAHEAAFVAAYREARAEAGDPVDADTWAAAFSAAVTWHLAMAVAWSGAEDAGFEEPRVEAIVTSLITNAAAAGVDHDTALSP